ncbi:MAG: helix-turn-helix domain-containing protein [Bacteroidales bacterium]|nr:helix-turn-helix domain-containing protein [Bacteroidales bacterium]
MSSSIKVQRICQHCGIEFTAFTTVTQFCSKICNSRAYKARAKAAKIDTVNKATLRLKIKPLEDLMAREFLTVREVAQLLSCSVRSVYGYIDNGFINSVNLGQRLTRIRRSDIDLVFNQQKQAIPPAPLVNYQISECYSITEAQLKFGISDNGLHKIIIRNNIPRIKQGKFTYIPKNLIDNLLS